MTKQEFTDALTDLLQEEAPIDLTTDLTKLNSWDSLAWMFIMAFAEKENLHRVNFSQLRAVSTAQELYALLTTES